MTAKKTPKPKKLWALNGGTVTAAAHTKSEARALFKAADGPLPKGAKIVLVKEDDS